MKEITLGSLFDGIGGWPLAAIHANIKPLWASEIAKFPQAVTKTHFPNMLQLGDIMKINGEEIEPVDIVCMGSPCQDLSVGGHQEGLKGARSGLFFRAINIIKQMQERTKGEYPKFVVWENVPGAFYSNQGQDFRTILEEIAENSIPVPRSGKWATAGMVRSQKCNIVWRVLDAKYWGVPQQRKRIFLIADYRTIGRCPEEILFESKSLSRRTTSIKTTIEKTSEQTEKNIANSGNVIGFDAYNNAITGNYAATLGVNCGMSTGRNQVFQESYCISGKIIGRKNENTGNGKGILKEISYSLNTIDRHAIACTTYQDYVGALTNSDYKGIGNQYVGQNKCIIQNSIVRRLTPLECERLQGLPDNYTLIDDDSCSEAARYKALGNGMAQPCADWIIKRIVDNLLIYQ